MEKELFEDLQESIREAGGMKREEDLKDIPGFPDYRITKDGRVWSKRRRRLDGNQWIGGKWLKSITIREYLHIYLYRASVGSRIAIHRLVLETYVGPCPDGMEACHNNGDKTDNRLENLRWDTPKNNQADRKEHGTLSVNRGFENGMNKLSEQDVRMIIYMYRTGEFMQKEIAEIYKVTQSTISQIINRKRWGHIWTDKEVA